MMSSASLMRQPSSDPSSHLGSSETNALIHAVLQLSRERGLAVQTVGQPQPPYMAATRHAVHWTRNVLFAAALLAFGGFSYWMGANQGAAEAPAVATTQPAELLRPALATAPTNAAAVAFPAPATAPVATQVAAAAVETPGTHEDGQTSEPAKAQIDPALVQALMAALAQAKHAPAEAVAPKAVPKPAPAPAKSPAAAAQPKLKAAPPPKPTARPAQESVKPKDDGVSVDLASLGTAQSVAAPIRRPAPPAEVPVVAPAPAVNAFNVVSVLDGMVLVQQGRRVSPVAVGQALPDGKVLHSADSASGKFLASKP